MVGFLSITMQQSSMSSSSTLSNLRSPPPLFLLYHVAVCDHLHRFLNHPHSWYDCGFSRSSSALHSELTWVQPFNTPSSNPSILSLFSFSGSKQVGLKHLLSMKLANVWRHIFYLSKFMVPKLDEGRISSFWEWFYLETGGQSKGPCVSPYEFTNSIAPIPSTALWLTHSPTRNRPHLNLVTWERHYYKINDYPRGISRAVNKRDHDSKPENE